MGCAGGAALGVGRSQPVRDCVTGNLVDEGRASKTGADRSLPELWSAGCDADGSRDAVVEHESGGGMDMADGVDHETRNPDALQRVSASADARESGTISRSVGSGHGATRNSGQGGTPELAG